MKRILAAVVLVAASAPSQAQTLSYASTSLLTSVSFTSVYLVAPTWKCRRADGTTCTDTDLANPYYKQIVILPTGFSDSEKWTFWSEFDRIVNQMTGTSAGTTWSAQKKSRLLFVGYFVSGGALGTSTAAFKAKVASHPIRGYALTLDQASVYSKADEIRYYTLPHLKPFTVGVLFNSLQTGVTANASPPGFVGKSYGVARFTRQDLNERGTYITVHELAHSGLNFLDEYVEDGLESYSIRQLDALTPLALFDGSWGSFINAINDLIGVYDYNISEILAGNGNDNIALSSWPTTVYTPGYSSESYPLEGGMFFGRGTYKDSGANVMSESPNFGYAHSPSQQRVVETAFSGVAGRPNNRIRTAGPKNDWPLELGSSTTVMIYDGDKHHHFQPTKTYDVQVGWYERVWKTCWWEGFVPYPCYNDIWTTAQKTVYPGRRTIELKTSSLYGLANLVQKVLCGLGISEIPAGDQTFNLCSQDLATTSDAFLPTLKFSVPYHNTTVPASQWFTTYWWRVRTTNGTSTSGYTGWSSFYRSF